MNGINLILLFLALLGILPLAIILYKKNRVKKILTAGLPAEASVYDIRRIIDSQTEIVHYKFIAQNNAQYLGSLTVKPGLYKMGDTLKIYYLPSNPSRNTMHGAWGSPIIVGFGILIAVFILFAVYKLSEMIKTGNM